MKLSLLWIFDHIEGAMQDYDVQELAKKLSITTAEIESVTRLKTNIHTFTLARVIKITEDAVTVACGQKDTEATLPLRVDAIEGAVYFITKEPKAAARWSTIADFHGDKIGLMPAISCTQKEFEGTWQKEIEGEDYIIEVDNSSITHRRDLWSHRGFAREVAAILGLSLKSDEHFLAAQTVHAHELYASSTSGSPFALEIQDTSRCKRLAGVYMPGVGHYASWIWMATRLCRVDAKPIDGIVDATNYVMLDIGQPLHAFDADAITTKQLIAKTAKQGTPLVLLDGQTIELSSEDLVISNGVKPLALAGIMGGRATGISLETRSIMVEAATFDAASIRKSSQRHKIRTEASVRFEKTLDTHLNVLGLQRFIKLLDEQKIELSAASDIISLGKVAPAVTISLTHEKIEQMLGITISSETIEHILTPLGFSMVPQEIGGLAGYKIAVPSFRATKEFEHAQDIIEEIGRFYGYGNIPLELPHMQIAPSDLTPVDRRRAVTEYLASSMRAREVKKYPVFDEQFLHQLDWQPEHTVDIKNPLSDNWRRMITSLVPHLLHCILENEAQYDQLRFFEWGRQWQLIDGKVLERKIVAAIFYDQHTMVDFYEIKDQISHMYQLLGFDITWHKVTPELPWYHPYQTAAIRSGHYTIGMMGIAHPEMLSKIAHGHAVIAELDADFLTTAPVIQKRYVPVPVYQDSSRDMSFFIPLSVTVAQLEKAIKDADSRIFRVELIDYFERKEWENKRAITMRFYARDAVKTLTKDEIDSISAAVIKNLTSAGASIR